MLYRQRHGLSAVHRDGADMEHDPRAREGQRHRCRVALDRGREPARLQRGLWAVVLLADDEHHSRSDVVRPSTALSLCCWRLRLLLEHTGVGTMRVTRSART